MQSDDSPLICELAGNILTLRLNRPERLNAVSPPLYQALETALRDIGRDRSVRAVLVTGTGRAFCVGADLKAHRDDNPTAQERRAYVWAAQRVNRMIQTLPQPVVAALNGHAVGAGLELALSCDFIVVAEDAKLRLPEVALGTFFGGGVSYTLADRVGLAKAKEIILLSEFFSGRDAAAMGLAQRSVPAERVLDTARRVAERLALQAPISLARAKHLLNEASRLGPRRALAREARALQDCMKSRDWLEGIEAFHEKRPPEFVGE